MAEQALVWTTVGAPLLGAATNLLLGLVRTGRSENAAHVVGLASTVLAFAATVVLVVGAPGGTVDAVTAWLLAATGLGGVAAAGLGIPARDADPRHPLRRHVPALYAALLATQSGIALAIAAQEIGVLVAGWLLASLPPAFMAGHWGGFRRERAALRMGLSAAVSSLLLVTALAWVAGAHHAHEPFTTDLRVLAARALERPWPDQAGLPATVPFVLLLAALALRFPLPPLHTWSYVAHEEAPAPVSILLSAMLPLAGFAVLLRVGFGLFARELAALSDGLVTWGAAAAVYAALVALAQKDLKRLVGMLAVSTYALALFAAFTRTPQGLDAALLLVLSGAAAGSLAFVVATGLSERAGHRHLDGFGGIAERTPRLALGLAGALLSFGLLPATSGFPGLFFTITAALPTHPGLTALALWTPLLASAAAVWTLQRIHLGPLNERYRTLGDATPRERVLVGVLTAAVLLLAFGSVVVTTGTHGLLAELARGVAFR